VEAMLARAEALTNAHRYDEAIEELENSRTAVLATGAAELEQRSLMAEAWARMERGEVRPAIQLLERCRTIAEGPGFSDVDRAKAYCEQLNDERNVGRLLNNLGGLNFQLGKPEQAIEQLKDAYRVLLDKGSEAEAANVVSSLAHVHLMTGQVQSAEEEARHALQLLPDREDFLVGIASTQQVPGPPLLEQGRLDEAQETLSAAEASADQLESISHRAAAWLAQGDLAGRRGEDATAARLYRKAAEALQDVRF